MLSGHGRAADQRCTRAGTGAAGIADSAHPAVASADGCPWSDDTAAGDTRGCTKCRGHDTPRRHRRGNGFPRRATRCNHQWSDRFDVAAEDRSGTAGDPQPISRQGLRSDGRLCQRRRAGNRHVHRVRGPHRGREARWRHRARRHVDPAIPESSDGTAPDRYRNARALAAARDRGAGREPAHRPASLHRGAGGVDIDRGSQPRAVLRPSGRRQRGISADRSGRGADRARCQQLHGVRREDRGFVLSHIGQYGEFRSGVVGILCRRCRPAG